MIVGAFTCASREQKARRDSVFGSRSGCFNGFGGPEATHRLSVSSIAEVLGEEPVHGVLTTIETEVKYAGYIAQQQRQMDRLRESDLRRIPAASNSRGFRDCRLKPSRNWSASGRRPSARRAAFLASRPPLLRCSMFI